MPHQLGPAIFFIAISGLCATILLTMAYSSSFLKGLLCTITCGIYLFFWSMMECRSRYKWILIAGWIGFAVVGRALWQKSISGITSKAFPTS